MAKLFEGTYRFLEKKTLPFKPLIGSEKVFNFQPQGAELFPNFNCHTLYIWVISIKFNPRTIPPRQDCIEFSELFL